MSREVSPTGGAGDAVTVDGARLTVPTGSKVTQGTTSTGVPKTIVRMPEADTVTGLPGLSFIRVDSFGRPLLDETYAQEVMLAGQGLVNTSVTRSAETWPGSDEVYLMTWDTSVMQTSGEALPESCLSFWVSDGTGGGWVVTAVADAGTLKPGTDIWDAAFSLQVTR